MCQVKISGREILNEFVQECLINGKIGLFNSIKKSNLKTGLKSEKSQKIKLFQLFKWIAKHLDLSLTNPKPSGRFLISYNHRIFINCNS